MLVRIQMSVNEIIDTVIFHQGWDAQMMYSDEMGAERILDFVNYYNYKQIVMSRLILEVPEITAPSCALGTNGSNP